MADIFISYAREDREWAEALSKALVSQGWTTWWDTRLTAGERFDFVIQDEIDEAKCVVVLWSSKSIRSPWVIAEAREGLEREILVSVLIENVRPPFAHRLVYTANLIGWNKEDTSEKFGRLAKYITTILGPSSKEIGERDQQSKADLEREQAEKERDKADLERAKAAWEREQAEKERAQAAWERAQAEKERDKAAWEISKKYAGRDSRLRMRKVKSEVYFGTSLPSNVTLNERFVIRIAAYTKDYRHKINTLFESESPSSSVNLDSAKTEWRKGVKVEVHVSSDHLDIDDPDSHFTWPGDWEVLCFDAKVHDKVPVSKILIKIDLIVAGFPIVRIRPEIPISVEEPVKKNCRFRIQDSQKRICILLKRRPMGSPGSCQITTDCYRNGYLSRLFIP